MQTTQIDLENPAKNSGEIQSRRKVGVDVFLARADRRLLLGASLRLLAHRFSCGKPILRDDVARVASLADDAVERAA